ncbi:MAG: recombination protein O N-terminal domain-containing protein [Lentisphaeria bacterium]|nr:recombination protein O N-terminal domain-containing protein [Lentisphaeria bacterium]
MNPLVTTDYLVLRKTPYAETSLIVAGLTPDHGQVHLILKGARRLGKRSFPALDLFRLVRVSYREGKGEMHNPSEVEPVEDFGALASRVGLYRAAGELARFVLANVLPGVAHPAVFQALRVALARFAAAEAEPPGLADSAHVCLHLAYLHEGGWLAAQFDERARRQCAQLLDMALGGTPLALRPETWRELRRWTESLLRQAEFQIPE